MTGNGETPRRRSLPPCPICGKPAQDDLKPFCSSRCADVDLGRWLGERYAIPGPESEDGEPSERAPEDGLH